MKKKGFTLVEIIISLVLIILIGTITIISLRKNEPNNANKPQEELNTAVDVTADKLKSDDSLKQFIASETDDGTTNIISYFCFTKETLIKEGLITEENEILKNIKPNEYIKVSQDSVGTYVFDHPVTEDECSYLKSKINDDDLENTETKVINKLDEEQNGYYFSQELRPKSNVDNEYELITNFQFNTGKLSDTSFRPDIYTIFIVDASGSMCNNRWSDTDALCKSNNSMFQQAMDAAKALSENLTAVNTPSNSFKNYVLAISFASDVSSTLPAITAENYGFKTTKLVNDDFYFVNGGTCYKKALTAAYDRINGMAINKEKSRFFVIFLTDGADGCGSYTTPANNIKNFLKPTGSSEEYGKLITVGFDFNNSVLTNIGSTDCKGTGTNCYYTASSSASSSSSNNIINVFSGFLEVIEKQVMCSTYKKAQMKITLSDNFNFADGTKETIVGPDDGYINLECNETDLTTNLQTQTLLDNALTNIIFNQPDTSSLTPGIYTFSIIKNITIDFYNADNNKIESFTLDEDDFPTITLNIDKIEVIN